MPPNAMPAPSRHGALSSAWRTCRQPVPCKLPTTPCPSSLGWVQRVAPARHVHQLRRPVPACHRAACAHGWVAKSAAKSARPPCPPAACSTSRDEAPAAQQRGAAEQAQHKQPAAVQHPSRVLTLPQRWVPPTPGMPRRAARCRPAAAPRPPRPPPAAPALPPPPRPLPAAAPAGPHGAPAGSRWEVGQGDGGEGKRSSLL